MSQPSQKIYTRQLQIPRTYRPVTAKELKRAVQKQLQPGEKLIQLALTSVEADHLLVEVGIQRSGV